MNVAVQTAPESSLIERRRIRFQVVSPIHIGTREGRLLPMEFLFAGGKVHIIDEDKLGRVLKDRGLLDEFVHAARTGEIGKGVGWFLKQKGHVGRIDELAQRLSGYSVEGGAAEMRDFRPCVRDGFGRIYLPGTSLKGVFRTAVLYAFLKANVELQSSIEQKTRQRIDSLATERNKERAKKSLSEKFLQADLLQSFALANAKQENRDLLRCLTVRDAYPIAGSCRSRVLKIQFLSKKREGGFYWSKQKRGGIDTDTPLSIWLEAVVAGTFETEILWDRALFTIFKEANPAISRWPVGNLEDLLTHISTMTQDLIKHERGFFVGAGEAAAQSLKSWYDGLSRKMFRIGFGAGMLGTTVNLLWSDPIRQKIRNTCGHPRGEDPAPKSRRIWQDAQGEWLPMGWLLLVTGEQESTTEPVLTQEPETTKTKPLSSISPIKPAIRPKLAHPVMQENMPNVDRLLAQVNLIQLNDTLNIERVIDKLDELKASDATRVAQTLKDRLEKAGRWKKHPRKDAIQMFLTE